MSWLHGTPEDVDKDQRGERGGFEVVDDQIIVDESLALPVNFSAPSKFIEAYNSLAAKKIDAYHSPISQYHLAVDVCAFTPGACTDDEATQIWMLLGTALVAIGMEAGADRLANGNGGKIGAGFLSSKGPFWNSMTSAETPRGIRSYIVAPGGNGRLSDSLPRKLPKTFIEEYEEIRAGRGTPQVYEQGHPQAGQQKIFRGDDGHNSFWQGAKEWLVPAAKDPGNARILQKTLPDGRIVMGYSKDHYETIHKFDAPHFPDNGWR
ncbi:hypothetical protein OG689_43355 [Kitasatospora sp. NBC_00240]|uniref:hypothetical protein n=1 Tax=Kitasatospora sp. NBC_00240 TaxID=2903567 RepID=UPI0022552FB9|nr:hypothetical protein [Kitasatospora sp. NBC_00240]MCX5215979.1 hypothetical protein [Kitasatospora sp. NBC_00240]